MLPDDSATVDTNDFSIWEGLADGAYGFLVKVRLVVGGYEDGAIYHQVVGIGGR